MSALMRKKLLFVGRNESGLYALEASNACSHEESFNPVGSPSFDVAAALRVLSKDFLEDISNAVLCLKMHSTSASIERK